MFRKYCSKGNKATLTTTPRSFCCGNSTSLVTNHLLPCPQPCPPLPLPLSPSIQNGSSFSPTPQVDPLSHKFRFALFTHQGHRAAQRQTAPNQTSPCRATPARNILTSSPLGQKQPRNDSSSPAFASFWRSTPKTAVAWPHGNQSKTAKRQAKPLFDISLSYWWFVYASQLEP